MDIGELEKYVAGGNELWRKILVCKETTREIHATVAVEDTRNPGGPSFGRDSDNEEDDRRNSDGCWEDGSDGGGCESDSGEDAIDENSEGDNRDEDSEGCDHEDPGEYEVMKVFTSEEGITLGDPADWPCELRDLASGSVVLRDVSTAFSSPSV